jgi:hypothetical protein
LAAVATAPVVGVQTVAGKLRGAAFEIATAAPETAGTAAPGPWIAEAMSSALDKYQDMASMRPGAGQAIDAAY